MTHHSMNIFEYFGINKQPFQVGPDPRYLYSPYVGVACRNVPVLRSSHSLVIPYQCPEATRRSPSVFSPFHLTS
jgi:hypothetical protein